MSLIAETLLLRFTLLYFSYCGMNSHSHANSSLSTIEYDKLRLYFFIFSWSDHEIDAECPNLRKPKAVLQHLKTLCRK